MRIVFELENKRAAAYDGDKLIGESTYSDAGKIWIIDHTHSDDSYRGQGIGKKLVYELVEAARKHDKKIMPLCPYAKMQFEKNQDYRDVLSI